MKNIEKRFISIAEFKYVVNSILGWQSISSELSIIDLSIKLGELHSGCSVSSLHEVDGSRYNVENPDYNPTTLYGKLMIAITRKKGFYGFSLDSMEEYFYYYNNASKNGYSKDSISPYTVDSITGNPLSNRELLERIDFNKDNEFRFICIAEDNHAGEVVFGYVGNPRREWIPFKEVDAEVQEILSFYNPNMKCSICGKEEYHIDKVEVDGKIACRACYYDDKCSRRRDS